MMPNNGKSPLESKTLWFNLLALFIVVASAYGFTEFVPDLAIEDLGKGIVALLGILVPIINMGLRLITKKPIKL